MHVVDIIFALIGAALLILGAKRGLIGEVFRLLAVVGGFAAAVFFYRPVYAALESIEISSRVKVALSFVAVFLAGAAALLAIGWLVRKVIHLTPLGWVDRLCGAGLGLLKTLLIAWISVLSISALPLPDLHANLEHSHVFTLCRQLPLQLRVPGTDFSPRSLERAVDPRALERLRDARKKLDTFRDKVDSAKAYRDSI